MGLKEIFLGIKGDERLSPSVSQDICLVKIYYPQTEIDLALIKGLLAGDHIPYFVHNDTFGSLYVGAQIELYNQKVVMVEEKFVSRARELIRDFLEGAELGPAPDLTENYSWADTIRMFLEFGLGGWIVPRKGLRGAFPKADIAPILTGYLIFATILFVIGWIIKGVIDFYNANHLFG